MSLHPVVERVTARIADRSRATRAAYLARMEAQRTDGPARRALACGNLAHGFAAAGTDKAGLRAAFAADPAIAVHPLTTTDGDPRASLAHARRFLAAHPHAFDVVLLGMGADGHVASLFPGARNLAEGLDLAAPEDAIGVLPDPLPPEAPYPRISLTLPRLLRAREVHLVVTGDDKRRVLRDAQRQDAGTGLPVAALLHARADAPIRIHWSP